jgi:hypothetical protein
MTLTHTVYTKQWKLKVKSEPWSNISNKTSGQKHIAALQNRPPFPLSGSMSLAPQPADQAKGPSPSHLQLWDLKQRHNMTVTTATRSDTAQQVTVHLIGYSKWHNSNKTWYGMASESYVWYGTANDTTTMRSDMIQQATVTISMLTFSQEFKSVVWSIIRETESNNKNLKLLRRYQFTVWKVGIQNIPCDCCLHTHKGHYNLTGSGPYFAFPSHDTELHYQNNTQHLCNISFSKINTRYKVRLTLFLHGASHLPPSLRWWSDCKSKQ